MHWNQLRSQISQVFQVTSHIVGIFALHFVSPIHMLSLYQFNQFLTCTRIPCRDSHCENGLVRCYLHTPRRLQQTAVSCKRSNCNKIRKNRESRTSEVLSKDGKHRASPFYHFALHVSSFVDFLWIIIMRSTRNRSIATNWRKNSMIGARIDTSRMVLAWFVVQQILGVDGLMWTTHRGSQNELSMVFENYWEKSTNLFCIESNLLASYDGRNLFGQARPSWYRPLHFDHVRVEMHEIQDRSQSDGGSFENAFWCISLKLWAIKCSLCFVVFPYRWPWGRPFLMTKFWIERRSNVHWMAPRLASLSFKRCPQVQWTMPWIHTISIICIAF